MDDSKIRITIQQRDPISNSRKVFTTFSREPKISSDLSFKFSLFVLYNISFLVFGYYSSNFKILKILFFS